MINKLENNDIISSVKTTIRDRLVSIMYGTFIISWCIWNWELIYITVFVDQDIILKTVNQLKIDYILTQYSWDNWLGVLWSSVKLLLGPIIMTYVIIWWFSKLDFICFKRYHSDKFNKKNELFKMENKLLNKEKTVLEKKEENVEIEKKIQKEMTDEEKWNAEYKDFRSSNQFHRAIKEMQQCIYEHSGYLDTAGYRMRSEITAYLHVNGLIAFSEKSRNIITATEKGKYYLRKFIKERG